MKNGATKLDGVRWNCSSRKRGAAYTPKRFV